MVYLIVISHPVCTVLGRKLNRPFGIGGGGLWADRAFDVQLP
jgi:hypothetical protein